MDFFRTNSFVCAFLTVPTYLTAKNKTVIRKITIQEKRLTSVIDSKAKESSRKHCPTKFFDPLNWTHKPHFECKLSTELICCKMFSLHWHTQPDLIESCKFACVCVVRDKSGPPKPWHLLFWLQLILERRRAGHASRILSYSY